MSEYNETLAEIVADMRHGFNQSWYDIDREWAHGLADRIEAAYKREMSKIVSKNGADFGQLGDAARLREALKLCIADMCGYCRIAAALQGDAAPCLNACETLRIAKAALSAPPRNCDVGKEQEQYVRFLREYCNSEPYIDRRKKTDRFSSPCAKCYSMWAQMPYEANESEAK